MTSNIYYYDFTEGGDSYRLGFYINEGTFDTTLNYIKCAAKSLIFENDLNFSQEMPDGQPFGLQLADTLKLKINLINNNLPVETLIKGYNGTINDKYYANNVWFLLKHDGTNYTTQFYGFQQIKPQNKLTQNSKSQIILDLELIGLHKFLLEKVTLEECLEYDLFTNAYNYGEIETLKLTNDAGGVTTIYETSSSSSIEQTYLTPIRDIIIKMSSKLTILGRLFTCNTHFDFDILDSIFDSWQFYTTGLDGTFTVINPIDNNDLKIPALINNFLINDPLDTTEIIGGALSNKQELGLTEFENLFDLFSKLTEFCVLRGVWKYGFVTNFNQIPYDMALFFYKPIDYAGATAASSKDFNFDISQEQGEQLAVLNANRKEVSEDDLNLLELKNAGIFNEKSFELQEVFNNNYNCITNGSFITRNGHSYNAYNLGVKSRTLFSGTQKIADKCSVDLGEAQFTDDSTSISNPEFLDSDVNFTNDFTTFVNRFNEFCISRQVTNGMSNVALKAINYMLSDYYIIEVNTILKDLRIGDVLNITDGLFYLSEFQRLGAGNYIIVGIDKTFWGETKLKLYKKG